MLIPVNLLKTHDQWQARAAVSAEHVDDLLTAYKAGATIPPVKVVQMPDGYYALVDGYHRHAARLAGGYDDVEVEIVGNGDADTAFLEALCANAEQTGLPRSRADKQRVAELAVKRWPEMPSSQIASLCALSEDFVSKTRDAMGLLSPTAAAREAVKKVKEANPKASLRAVAKAAGVSPGTAKRALESDAKPAKVKKEVPPNGPLTDQEGKALRGDADALFQELATPIDHIDLITVRMMALRKEIDASVKALGKNGAMIETALDDVESAIKAALSRATTGAKTNKALGKPEPKGKPAKAKKEPKAAAEAAETPKVSKL